MTIPYRGCTSESTYFITADCWEKQRLLQSDRMARLLIDVLYHYRSQQRYLLHEFVIMPNHIHLIITPTKISIQRAMQLVKGGFSFRAGRDIGIGGEIWQTSFHDRRIRDAGEYREYVGYVHRNPVTAGLVITPSEFEFSSAHPGFEVDAVPERLKPGCLEPSMQA